MKCRVATHNVCHMGMNPIDRSELFSGNTYRNGYPEEIVELMKREWANAYALFDADFIGIQEYFPWFDLKRSVVTEEQVYRPFGYAVEYGGRNLAFASKHPFKKIYQDTFEGISVRQKEKFTLNFDGRDITIFNSHPSPGPGKEEARRKEYEKLVELFDEEETFVAFGDYNARSADEFEPFVKAGYSMANTGISTEEKGNPTDNIIVSKNIKITSVGTFDKEFVLSDHAILWAELEIL